MHITLSIIIMKVTKNLTNLFGFLEEKGNVGHNNGSQAVFGLGEKKKKKRKEKK